MPKALVFQRTVSFLTVVYQVTGVYLSNSKKFLSSVCSSTEFEQKENQVGIVKPTEKGLCLILCSVLDF